MQASTACSLIESVLNGAEGGRQGVDFIDLNCGCPIDLIAKAGAGSALLERRNRLKEMVIAMRSVVGVPITVKLRSRSMLFMI